MSGSRCAACEAACDRCACNASSPSAPLTLDTAKMGASESAVPAEQASPISRSHCARRAPSTRSTLVIATAPVATPSSCTMSRCSSCLRHGPARRPPPPSSVIEVDARGTGDHVVDEALVAGHVDEADAAAAVGLRQVGIAQLDRDAARLFLLQPIGVHAGKRLHQGCLAVVDVSGRSDDHGASSARSAASSSSSSRHLRSKRNAPSATRPRTGTRRPRNALSRRASSAPEPRPAAAGAKRDAPRSEASRQAARRCRSGLRSPRRRPRRAHQAPSRRRFACARRPRGFPSRGA